jgi:hypothetical protein
MNWTVSGVPPYEIFVINEATGLSAAAGPAMSTSRQKTTVPKKRDLLFIPALLLHLYP